MSDLTERLRETCTFMPQCRERPEWRPLSSCSKCYAAETIEAMQEALRMTHGYIDTLESRLAAVRELCDEMDTSGHRARRGRNVLRRFNA